MARFQKPELNGWPTKDANIILFAEIVLIIGIFSMNGSDYLLQSIEPEHYKSTGHLILSSHLAPVLFGGLDASSLHIIERFGWWLHILVVFGFVLYLPYSKHLHIFLSFPNVYFSKLDSAGKMENIMRAIIKLFPHNMEAFAKACAENDVPFVGPPMSKPE